VPGAEHIADPWGSAGTTLEYAVDDFAVAQLARALGDTATCETFLARSGAWRHLVNPATGYVEPRRADGTFLAGYDPGANAGGAAPGDGVNGFAEGTAAQYTWMVPHDPAGLFAALGGPEAAVERLDAATAELNAGWVSEHVNLGNEPSSGTPWLYNWAGRPDRTQAVVRRALTELYPADPLGFPGNDDLGQTSAW
jgi:putative alpha-1,2-mannosidase